MSADDVSDAATTAFILALARDISLGVPMAILEKWRGAVLSTPCKFDILSASMDRYWCALRLRENISLHYKACHRTCYQRLYEVVRLMAAMRKRMAEPEAEVLGEREAEGLDAPPPRAA